MQIKDHFVVAIGASAGGLEAIHEFFDHMSESSNMSFVIIQHLSSDYKSLLVELVSRHTEMDVFEAENNTTIKKNCIYVIPNNKLITIDRNKLILEDKTNTQAPNTAIDNFLYSLAYHKKDKAIAVILSGTGTDGTKGIQAIKNNGGMVIIQDPETARFNGMPNSAIQLGITELIMAPADMPAEILSYIREPLLLEQQNFKEADLEAIFNLIHEAVGYDFHYYKLPTLLRRITRRMMQLGIQDKDEFIQLLRNNQEEARQLGNDFLIGVTRFFRDTEAFQQLDEKVIYPIISSKADHSTFKAWVCACSTGEEAYSIAMLINEAAEKLNRSLDIKIFASDIDDASIEIAAKGIYPQSIASDVPSGLLEKYFVKKGDQYHVLPRLRKQIIFAKHNVIRDPPYINNDLVSCRNMLIYVSPHLQQKIYLVLLFSLSRNGFLFLGSSEHSNYIRSHVDEISAKWKIYRKTKDSRLAGSYIAPMSQVPSIGKEHKRWQPAAPEKANTLWDEVKTALTEEVHFAAFYIDRNFNIRETTGNYEKFLTLPKKSLQLHLLSMLPPELYFVMSSEIKNAWREDKVVTLRNVKSRRDKLVFSWQISIKPMDPYTLVVMMANEVTEVDSDAPAEVSHGAVSSRYIAELENELQEVKTHLDLAVEDLETTNEELQSSNEELLSANEELQSSNEELQSLNEELHTLNTEHQLKIRELSELNDDLNNYFRSTDIAQIFLDTDLRIRRFNPASTAMVNIIDSDIGRQLSHISNNIQYDNFIQDAERVVRQKEHIEREVNLIDGKKLLMRMMPYLNKDRRISGVIITFVDITVITELNSTLRAILDSSPGGIIAMRAVRAGRKIDDFVVQTANREAATFLSRPLDTLPGLSLKNDLPELMIDSMFDHFVQVVETERELHAEIFMEASGRWFSVIAARMMDGLVVSYADITPKKRSEHKLKKNYLELVSVKDNLKKANELLESKVEERTRALASSEERFRLVARATNEGLWDWDLANNSVWWGESFYKLFGYDSNTEYTTRSFWTEKLHPDDRAAVIRSIDEAINSGNNQWSMDYRFARSNGEYAHILDRGYILHDEFGTPYRMLGSMFDVTELKNAEQKLATMNEQLELKVAERTRELEKINQALELSNNDLQQFASVASHDLQEPLRKIQMFAKMIDETSGTNPDDMTAHYVRKIIHSSQRMRSLITDILDYSRLSADDNSFVDTDIKKIISEILDDYELRIREKNARIDVGDLPTIQANPGQVRQIFQNLISNALKFTKAKGEPQVSITSKQLKAKSFDAPEGNGGYFLITVTDNGIGFEPAFAQNIFNLFQRLHSKDKYEGTGIGLAITKKIIDKHDGLIRATSSENEGACFEIILPLNHTQKSEK